VDGETPDDYVYIPPTRLRFPSGGATARSGGSALAPPENRPAFIYDDETLKPALTPR
jgi:hypothetical protein